MISFLFVLLILALATAEPKGIIGVIIKPFQLRILLYFLLVSNSLYGKVDHRSNW